MSETEVRIQISPKTLVMIERRMKDGDTYDNAIAGLVRMANCTHPERARRRDGSWCPDCGAVFFGKFIDQE